MNHVCLKIAYDGTQYAGWQIQPNAPTIQKAVEEALSKVTQESISILGSGRTDAGVHAKAQVASFKTTRDIELKAFIGGTNTFLPKDIRILDAQFKDDTFHPIKSTQSKTYRYFFCFGGQSNIFFDRYVYHIRHKLNVTSMQEAAAYFRGEHDFSSFVTHGQVTSSTVRTIFDIHVDAFQGPIFCLACTGNGFLRHMVRTIMGTLIDVGLEKQKPKDMPSIIQAKSRLHAGPTAPPQGLFLWEVRY